MSYESNWNRESNFFPPLQISHIEEALSKLFCCWGQRFLIMDDPQLLAANCHLYLCSAAAYLTVDPTDNANNKKLEQNKPFVSGSREIVDFPKCGGRGMTSRFFP